MTALYLLSVTIHVLAAMLWVGGMGFFALVVVPVVRRHAGDAQVRELVRGVGMRFASVGWVALGTLIVTGVCNLGFRGLLPALATGDFWRSSFGHVLAMKLTVVAAVLVVSLLHAREARRAAAGAATETQRAGTNRLGRATFLLSVLVVVLAVMLVRGAPW